MIEKTGFVVDEVSEESFYQNLLLGITKTLESSPCVHNTNLRRYRGLKDTDIRAWEHNNGVLLSEDMRNFYSSTNGFLFTYNFAYENNEGKVIAALGKIEMNPLENMSRTYGYETKPKGEIETVEGKYKLCLSRESKVFELSKIDDNNKVVLVYVNIYCLSSIWLYCAPYQFYFLADDFITYFRMCIAHLGIPYWQFMVTNEGIPEWSREMFHIIAPGVLQEDRNLIQINKKEYEELNKLDVSIFTMHHQYNENNAQKNKEQTVASPQHTSKKKTKKSTKVSHPTKARKS
ncbi:unnamed protein product [Brassicogethes aeneus]|uniref:Tubulin polyglutamylase complex subunit 2 n=1 Tax=Brassicogethes aeneus TaxID=1431903 RepID=A0A9P0ASW5_BRAAE|nr:unnamed protein product [Brassicogethes aeneus]